MTNEQHIEKVSTILKSGISREHSNRGDLETLIREQVKGVEVTNTVKQFSRIWINTEQCFENILITAWRFYIGGHKPAQKKLKGRKDRILKFENILHYQKIIVSLYETDRLMKEIDIIKIV